MSSSTAARTGIAKATAGYRPGHQDAIHGTHNWQPKPQPNTSVLICHPSSAPQCASLMLQGCQRSAMHTTASATRTQPLVGDSLTLAQASDWSERFRSADGMLVEAWISAYERLSASLKSIRTAIWYVLTLSSCLRPPKSAFRSAHRHSVVGSVAGLKAQRLSLQIKGLAECWRLIEQDNGSYTCSCKPCLAWAHAGAELSSGAR